MVCAMAGSGFAGAMVPDVSGVAELLAGMAGSGFTGPGLAAGVVADAGVGAGSGVEADSGAIVAQPLNVANAQKRML